jgi:predicted metalloprotease with PDZ domain
MVTTNFHTAERTRLLWIYEGLTQYLGEVLTVRSGLLSQDEYLTQFAGKIDWLMRQAGRQWRSVDDTARASWMLRGTRTNMWAQLRRSQDYYDEGLLVWLEADALIRDKTGGRKSLDDFCKQFFAKQRDATSVARYELDEVHNILRGLVADIDWPKFFHERIEVPRKDLGLEFVEKLGYRIQYSARPSEYITERDASRKQTTANASIGITVSEEGSKITSVVPGMPGDKAGLAAGMVVAGVNGRKFTPQRLKDGIADSVANQGVELLVIDGDSFRTIKIPYAEGPKYLELVRRPENPDTLGAILKPTLKEEK